MYFTESKVGNKSLRHLLLSSFLTNKGKTNLSVDIHSLVSDLQGLIAIELAASYMRTNEQ